MKMILVLVCFKCANGSDKNRVDLRVTKLHPRDGGAWWAAVYGVVQSRTRLNRLSSSSSMDLIADNSTSSNFSHHQLSLADFAYLNVQTTADSQL